MLQESNRRIWLVVAGFLSILSAYPTAKAPFAEIDSSIGLAETQKQGRSETPPP
ncbi:hypothetical protein FIBSPDRAFT_968487 [Athelia psychrophila]|uniref:Uncharacterized protein n=1 Tax=Athelia psychrophila TaxID=1759441 RepID=A0A167UJX5_9AGAM|nr:hypothetical protein FIBSPDRAFT_968487 [Fibularhizoctonia sp. CBS 109695]